MSPFLTLPALGLGRHFPHLIHGLFGLLLGSFHLLRYGPFHLLYAVAPLIIRRPGSKVLDGGCLLRVVVAPKIIPVAVLLGKLPCDKGSGRSVIFSQRKALAIVKENGLPDLITSVLFKCDLLPKC